MLYDGRTVKCTVNDNFPPVSKVNLNIYILRLVFNSYSQLFTTILRLTTVKHFEFTIHFHIIFFMKGSFNMILIVASRTILILYTFSVTKIYICP